MLKNFIVIFDGLTNEGDTSNINQARELQNREFKNVEDIKEMYIRIGDKTFERFNNKIKV